MKVCKKNACLYDDVIHCLVGALDYRDHYTKGHSTRVGDMAVDIANWMGLDDSIKELIHIAGHLHDIGKIGIPDSILKKDGPLSDEEWQRMKEHPQIGAQIVKKSESLQEVSRIILEHHERWDGYGYPKGKKGHEIHLAARIIALADTIDAMASNRSYRRRFDFSYIRSEILRNAGKQFDPDLVQYIDPIINKWQMHYEIISQTA